MTGRFLVVLFSYYSRTDSHLFGAYFNPILTSGLVHPYFLDEFIYQLRSVLLSLILF